MDSGIESGTPWSTSGTAAQTRNKPGFGRFAPSPSGQLHLGNLRTAVLAWLFARVSGRKFIIRLDDIDVARNRGTFPEQLADLRGLGLTWERELLTQSERTPVYEDFLRELIGRELVYECFCTRADILEAPRAPHEPPGSYPGTCRDLSETERQSRRAEISPRAPALRLRVDGLREVSFTDLVGGSTTGHVDDFVLRRGDGVYAYNFVTVVDDWQSGVDQVVRGDDLLLSTPRQILLYREFGIEHPEYAHVPLVLNAQGQRLAKRDGAVTLRQLNELGVAAESVLRWILESSGVATSELPRGVTSRELLESAASLFDPAQLPRDPLVFKDRTAREWDA